MTRGGSAATQVRMSPRSVLKFAPRRPLLAGVSAAIVLAAAGLAAFGFPPIWTSAYLVAGLSLLLVLMLVRSASPAREGAAVTGPLAAPEAASGDDPPLGLAQARARAARRRAKAAAVKTKVRRV